MEEKGDFIRGKVAPVSLQTSKHTYLCTVLYTYVNNSYIQAGTDTQPQTPSRFGDENKHCCTSEEV